MDHNAIAALPGVTKKRAGRPKKGTRRAKLTSRKRVNTAKGNASKKGNGTNDQGADNSSRQNPRRNSSRQNPHATSTTRAVVSPQLEDGAVSSEGEDEESLEGEDEPYHPPICPMANDSPSKNTRSKKRTIGESDDDDSDVDEEIYLNKLEEYYQGTSKPKDQLYRKQDKLGRNIFTKDEHRQRRMAIYYFFSSVYGGPDESTGLWNGRNGIAARIRDQLMLPKTSNMLKVIKQTLRSIKECERLEAPYRGERPSPKAYEKYYIKKTDFEAQLIADLTEAGLGFTETTDKVNEWRRANGRVLPNGHTDVGRSCVYKTAKRLEPKVTHIIKRPQGSLDKNSAWCRASHRWACQMLIMLGELKEESQIPKTLHYDEKFGAMTELPKCFTISLVKKVTIECNVHLDEVHKQTRAGKLLGNTKVEHRFPRNADGALDFDDGKYRKRGSEMHMKYTKEARFCLAMCLKIDQEGKIVYDIGPNGEKRPLGKVLELFEYTGKKMTSDEDWVKIFWQVCKAAKKAPKKKPWYIVNRVEGAVYEGDPVTKLPDVGEKANEWLASRHNPITTVKEYYDFFKNPANIGLGHRRRKNFVNAVKGITMVKAANAMNVAEGAIKGNPPADTDHRIATNPCMDRWPVSVCGPNKWRDEVLNTSTMKKFVNVRDLVRHIHRICAEEYKNTMYQNIWTFYHDALSLVVSRACIDWMRTQGFLKHWVLPQHQLNDMFPHHKEKPIGNHPPAMPWDQSSNWDHDLMTLRHVAATSLLPEDDPRKFSLTTPDKVSYAYRRIYNNPVVERDGKPLMPAGTCGIPEYRLGHDVVETINYWWKVFNNEGLNQNFNTNGHRGDEPRTAAKEGKIKGRHGGPREKKPDKTDEESNWHHPDAVEPMENFFKNSMAAYNKRLNELEEEHRNITPPKDNIGLDPDLVEAQEITIYNNEEENNLQEQEEEEEEEQEQELDYDDDEVLLALAKC